MANAGSSSLRTARQRALRAIRRVRRNNRPRRQSPRAATRADDQCRCPSRRPSQRAGDSLRSRARSRVRVTARDTRRSAGRTPARDSRFSVITRWPRARSTSIGRDAQSGRSSMKRSCGARSTAISIRADFSRQSPEACSTLDREFCRWPIRPCVGTASCGTTGLDLADRGSHPPDRHRAAGDRLSAAPVARVAGARVPAAQAREARRARHIQGSRGRRAPAARQTKTTGSRTRSPRSVSSSPACFAWSSQPPSSS